MTTSMENTTISRIWLLINPAVSISARPRIRLPSTAPGSEPRSDPDHEPLIASTSDIGARIAGIKARPTASAFAGDWPLRFSLAGAQAKFALARIGGSWYRPDAQTPSTHIVKPGAARNKHIEAFEARAMDLVRRAGFAVPQARVAHFDDQSAYVVERFDRELMPSGFSRRLHVEDLQQALGRDPTALKTKAG